MSAGTTQTVTDRLGCSVGPLLIDARHTSLYNSLALKSGPAVFSGDKP